MKQKVFFGWTPQKSETNKKLKSKYYSEVLLVLKSNTGWKVFFFLMAFCFEEDLEFRVFVRDLLTVKAFWGKDSRNSLQLKVPYYRHLKLLNFDWWKRSISVCSFANERPFRVAMMLSFADLSRHHYHLIFWISISFWIRVSDILVDEKIFSSKIQKELKLKCFIEVLLAFIIGNEWKIFSYLAFCFVEGLIKLTI